MSKEQILPTPFATRRRRAARTPIAPVRRNLFNRMIGQLYRCLQQGQHYDEAVAFATETEASPQAA